MDKADSTVGFNQSMDRVLDYLTGSFKVWTTMILSLDSFKVWTEIFFFAKSDLAKNQDMDIIKMIDV